MLLSLSGASGVGKTYTARLLSLAVPSIHILSGDRFIRQDGDDFEGLLAELDECRFCLFEHVSADQILDKFGIVPDYSVHLQDKSSRSTASPKTVQRHYHDLASTPDEALASIISHIQTHTDLAPVTSFVLKIASQCNLNCGYCYMYQGADQSWRGAQNCMDLTTLRLCCDRIVEYIESMQTPPRVSLILHGGEPLSVGLGHLRESLKVIKCVLGHHQSFVNVGVQTNATLLSEEAIALFDEFAVSVGVSLDGFSENENSRRPNHAGRSSLEASLKGISLLTNYPWKNGSFGGLLAVLGNASDGKAFYRTAKKLNIPAIDFLPLGPNSNQIAALPDGSTDLRFLISVFNEWTNDNSPIRIRFFESIVSRLMGRSWNVDSFGFAPTSVLGVSHTGEWEYLDCLRLTFRGAWTTGQNVQQNAIRDVLSGDLAKRVHRWNYGYSELCVNCSHFQVCGAGYLPHRYDRNGEFANPSKNCDLLYGIIDHVDRYLKDELEVA